MAKKTSIGGQAVIEGIMMKGPKKTALAVRTPDGSIDIEYIEEKHLKDKCKIFGWPIIRGSVNFIESMITGYKAMMKSADKSGFTDLEEDKKKPENSSKEAAENAPTEAVEKGEEANLTKEEEPAAQASTEAESSGEITAEDAKNEKKQSKLLTVLMIVASVLGVGLSIVLFMYLPAWIFDFIFRPSPKDINGSMRFLKVVFEGVLKMVIFFLYILLVSRMKDIRRVFQYHGAEHKTIFCYEAGLPLTAENSRSMSRFHPRCGTSFMILMLVVGIILGIVITGFIPKLASPALRIAWVFIKILILPVICGLGYELLKICGRHDNALTRAIAAPGMWMQRLTTVEPEDDMLEVAIKSIKAVLPENEDEDNW